MNYGYSNLSTFNIGIDNETHRIQSLFKVPINGINKPIHPHVAKLSVDKVLNHILVPKHYFDRILTNPKCEEGLRRLLTMVIDLEIKGVLDLATGEFETGTAWIR